MLTGGGRTRRLRASWGRITATAARSLPRLRAFTSATLTAEATVRTGGAVACACLIRRAPLVDRLLPPDSLHRSVRITLPVEPDDTDDQRQTRGDSHRREPVDQWRTHRERSGKGVTVRRDPGDQQHHAGYGDRQDQRRLHHRPEQATALDSAHSSDGSDEVADLEHPGEGVLRLHVDRRADHGEAERQQDGSRPGQAASVAGDGTFVPPDGNLVGVRIALAIANSGHEATP